MKFKKNPLINKHFYRFCLIGNRQNDNSITLTKAHKVSSYRTLYQVREIKFNFMTVRGHVIWYLQRIDVKSSKSKRY